MENFFKNLFGKNDKQQEIKYWHLGGKYQEDYALCSDNSCPCPGPGVIINRGQGYIYVVEHNNNGAISYSANLTCELGAKNRKLNLVIARKDAQHWWNTGDVPCRQTPVE